MKVHQSPPIPRVPAPQKRVAPGAPDSAPRHNQVPPFTHVSQPTTDLALHGPKMSETNRDRYIAYMGQVGREFNRLWRAVYGEGPESPSSLSISELEAKFGEVYLELRDLQTQLQIEEYITTRPDDLGPFVAYAGFSFAPVDLGVQHGPQPNPSYS